MSREEKLRAAKDKLAKFQKKKKKGALSNSELPTTPDDVLVGASISAESFHEVILTTPINPMEAVEPSLTAQNNVSIAQQEDVQEGQYQEPELTANEQYYYDLYVDAIRNYDFIANQLVEVQTSYQAEIDRLSSENKELQIQLSTPQAIVFEDFDAAASRKDIVNMKTSQTESLKRIDVEMAEQRKYISEQMEKLSTEDHRLSARERELQVISSQLNDQQESIALEKKKLDNHAVEIESRVIELELSTQQKDRNDMQQMEDAQNWLGYYKRRSEELDIINAQLTEQLQSIQMQPPVLQDSKSDTILQEVQSIRHDLKALSISDERVSQIEETNKQIVRLLETSSVSASSEFCKAVVELSKTNNHLLHFVSRNLLMPSMGANSIDQGISASTTTTKIMELKRLANQDISQQELVSSYDNIKRTYGSGTVLIEFLEVVLQHHFEMCDLLRLDFFYDIKANAHNYNTLKPLVLLTRDGRDLRHVEHEIGPLVFDWICHYGNEKKENIDIAGLDHLVLFVSNLIKFSFTYLSEEGIKTALDSLLLIVLDDKRLLSSSLGFVDSVLRYGIVGESLLAPFTKILFVGIADESELIVQQTESIAKNLMVSSCAALCVSQILANSNSDFENTCLSLGCVQLPLFIVKNRLYPFKGAGLILQFMEKIAATNNSLLAKPSLQLCLEIILQDMSECNSALVTIWSLWGWIWSLSDSKIDWDRQEKDMYYFHSELLRHFIDSVSHSQVPSQSLLKVLSTLLDNPSCISKHVARFIVSCFSNHFLWADTFSYLVVFDEAFSIMYNFGLSLPEIKMEMLAISFTIIESQMFHYSSQQRLETLTRRIIQLLASESNEKVLDMICAWVMRSIPHTLQSEVLLCFEVLLQACCGVGKTSETVSLVSFWAQFVSKNTKMQNIPHPATKSPSFTRRIVETSQSRFAVHALIQMFHQLVQFENSLSDEVFYWLCHISSWSAVCPPSVRYIALDFVTTLHTISNRRNPCYIYEGRVHTISSATLSDSLVDSRTRLFKLDHYLFAALAILEYEPSYKVLHRLFEALVLNLASSDTWISNGAKVILALRLLCDKVVTMIMTEFNFADLTFDVFAPLKKHDLFISLYQVLFVLFKFKNVFSKPQLDIMVPALLFGLSRWPVIARSIMQGLHLALYELPRNSITRHLPAVILKISQLTSSNLALANLEFLASLASLSSLHGNFTNEDYKRIFGIALTYLRQKGGANCTYQSVFAYYVVQVWFLGLKLSDRVKFVPMIVSTLQANTDKQIESSGGGSLDENVELVLDMMVQHSFVDCTPKPLVHSWSKLFGKGTAGKTWCQGNTLISIQKAEGGDSKNYELVFRRPVGLTVVNTEIVNGLGKMKFYDRRVEEMRSSLSRPSISAEASTAAIGQSRNMSSSTEAVLQGNDINAERSRSLSVENSLPLGNSDLFSSNFDPTFLILQFQPYPILSLPQEPPRLLGSDDSTIRAVSVLDMTPSIDLHKIGVIYVAPRQVNEAEILGNSAGSEFYTKFLLSLGQFVSLANNRDIYTGGLDTSPDCFDGRYGILFVPDQRLTQMIFHVTTLMPNNLQDPLSTAKKRHIGNDFVMIVWNEGGSEYNRNTIPGQFNLVQIVIEPLLLSSSYSYSNAGFRVSMWLRPDITMPTPLPVIVSGISLGSFVRQIAIYYNMIAQVFIGGEASSNAKERLRQIKRLKSRMDPIAAGAQSFLDFSSLINPNNVD